MTAAGREFAGVNHPAPEGVFLAPMNISSRDDSNTRPACRVCRPCQAGRDEHLLDYGFSIASRELQIITRSSEDSWIMDRGMLKKTFSRDKSCSFVYYARRAGDFSIQGSFFCSNRWFSPGKQKRVLYGKDIVGIKRYQY